MVDVSYPEVERTVRVETDEQLQDALADVRSGDEIVLAAGAHFSMQLDLPDPGDGWAILRGEADLPDGRITPDADLPVIAWDGHGGAIRAVGVQRWYIRGVEVTPDHGFLREGIVTQDASQIVFDRVRITAPGDGGKRRIQRGFRANGGDIALIDSRIEGVTTPGYESQAIALWDGPGPFRFENNFLEASSINILMGGAVGGQPMRDGVIHRNHLYKRPQWNPDAWDSDTSRPAYSVKNLLEWKAGQRWLVEDNVMENTWVDAQVGYGILIKSPDGATTDLTLRRNLVRNTANGVQLTDQRDQQDASGPLQRVLFEDLIVQTRGGRLLQLLGRNGDMWFRRMTITSDEHRSTHAAAIDEHQAPHLHFENIVIEAGTWGIHGDSDFRPATWKDVWMLEGERGCRNAPSNTRCVSALAEIPDAAGADREAVEAATEGVVDPHLP